MDETRARWSISSLKSTCSLTYFILFRFTCINFIFFLGKLHNLVYDIYLNTRLSWWLQELQQKDLKPGKKPLKVIRDNNTR
jgi:hypothetical protein